MQLEEFQILLMSSSDRQCFFYIFSLDECWAKAMTLKGRWPREWFAHALAHIRGTHVRLAVKGVPMGWLSAVGVCQHAHRNLLRLNFAPNCPLAVRELQRVLQEKQQEHLDWSREIRRDRTMPPTCMSGMRSSFQIYIDNLDEYEVIDAMDQAELEGTISPLAERFESLYGAWAAPGNPSKNFERVPVMTTLGITTHGLEGKRYPPDGVLSKLVGFTIWSLILVEVTRKHLQILGGRWVRHFQLARATSIAFTA
jgi:hypothetical protein